MRAALALFGLIALPGAVLAGDGAIEINQSGITSFPYEISQPGHYVLTSDLDVSTPGPPGLRVDTDNVSIDLNGFSVFFSSAGGSAADGIAAGSRVEIAVRNGSVRGFTGNCISVGNRSRGRLLCPMASRLLQH